MTNRKYKIEENSLLLLAGTLARCHFRQVRTVHRVFEPRYEHLVPALLTPKDFLLRSRVVAILERVVVVSDRDHLAPGRNFERLFEFVMKLPVEIKLRYAQQRLLSSVRPNQYVLDILPAQMHMRSEGVKCDVLFDRRLPRNFPVV